MRNFFDKARRIIGFLSLPIYFFILVALDLAFRFLYKTGDSVPLFDSRALVFTLCWALLICGILYALPVRARRIAMILVITFHGILCIVHAVMYHLFGSFFSFADLAYTEDGAKFFSFSYLKVRKALLLCVALAIAGAVLTAWSIPKRRYRWQQSVIALVMAAVAVAGIAFQHNRLVGTLDQRLITWDTASVNTDGDIYQNMNNVNRALSISGIYQYLWRSFTVSTGLDNRMQYGPVYQELDAYYSASPKQNHADNDMTGVFAGKNALFIMLESIDTWMLAPEYMPNLYGVQQDSMQFVNHYSPMFISAGTFNTEFTANTGLIPPTNGINTRVYTENDFPTSLANLFTAAGYQTNSFHSANPGIYNRGNIHHNLGYNAYHSWTDMGMENYMLDSQLIEGYDLMTAGDPFFSFIITFSGHGPYTDHMRDISDAHLEQARAAVDPSAVPATGSDLEEYIHAIAHAMETDAFVGELMDRLEQDGHLEDTVLIFFTDHYGKYMTNTQLLMDLKDVDNTDLLCNTPFFIYSADTEARTVTKFTSTMDIAPTVANLFDLDVNYAYYIGDDIFGDGGGYVIFKGNNWYDGEIYYTPNYTGELTEEIQTRNAEISRRVNAAWDTLRSNYFAHLE
ncbi:MAG: LTA synthase family protein [Faecousia sp.]